MITRRTFLIGSGSALSLAFVSSAIKYIERHGKPLIQAPTQYDGTLFVYEGGLITYGPWTGDADALQRPTWRECCVLEGVRIGDAVALAREMTVRGLSESELDAPIDDRCWPIAWEVTFSPSARAYRLLETLGIGPLIGTGKPHEGRLDFIEGGHPGNSDRWVEAYDDLTVSLLQSRLTELGQPLRVVMECSSVARNREETDVF